ncbi:hypothetical protein DPQ33_18035 [Oceanidesulfovibrio indonesiensis]|uniref:Putative zinc-finger domain-containing protein n=1 Tax=Oceanidesulfovibrio indonesiensis TaxID=54767 RepID=A0A7M3M9X4_9BACT|nr:zf-HC2 domain-containing protein [Oceanidesulfovibrio indonesiensis]TVM13871.1 hypothetical protein DPQ33_18035 [Oceanidesulfovibrio indonesiensis]
MAMCRKYQKRLGAYLDGELSERERAAIERHLSVCSSCRASMESMKRLAPIMKQLGPAPIPPYLSSRILAEAYAEAEKPKTRFMKKWPESFSPRVWGLEGLTTTALVLGLVLGGFLGWSSFQQDDPITIDKPYDRSAEILYGFDFLSATPQGTIEAATLALLENERGL